MFRVGLYAFLCADPHMKINCWHSMLLDGRRENCLLLDRKLAYESQLLAQNAGCADEQKENGCCPQHRINFRMISATPSWSLSASVK